ncbi:hypothetical protein M5K25_024798 [Dendrobium thyrsiflorum]|uniref:Uncharacterized protein n=1 Tax=Dendrobium thyrsiflorum TaxID=117978 RepID=A0ABD0U2Z6_DENTH
MEKTRENLEHSIRRSMFVVKRRWSEDYSWVTLGNAGQRDLSRVMEHNNVNAVSSASLNSTINLAHSYLLHCQSNYFFFLNFTITLIPPTPSYKSKLLSHFFYGRLLLPSQQQALPCKLGHRAHLLEVPFSHHFHVNKLPKIFAVERRQKSSTIVPLMQLLVQSSIGYELEDEHWNFSFKAAAEEPYNVSDDDLVDELIDLGPLQCSGLHYGDRHFVIKDALIDCAGATSADDSVITVTCGGSLQLFRGEDSGVVSKTFSGGDLLFQQKATILSEEGITAVRKRRDIDVAKNTSCCKAEMPSPIGNRSLTASDARAPPCCCGTGNALWASAERHTATGECSITV